MARDQTVTSCKICHASAPLHGVVDFNKSCEVHRGVFFPLSGLPVWYYRCDNCGFLFAKQFDGWTAEEWRRAVYNDDYARVDPDGADGSRARANLQVVLNVIQPPARVLDYGGGDGALANALLHAGVEAGCYDPMRGHTLVASPRYDLVTAFEVLEHTPTPVETTREILSCLREDGAMLFSTLTLDDLPLQAMDHWYIAPRNGHVSIHTTRSLDIMFGAEGFNVRHLAPGLHIAWRGVKETAAHGE